MIRKTTLGALAGLAIASVAHAQTYPINNPVYNPQALVATQAISAVGVSTAFQNNSTPTVCFRILGTFTGLVANLQISEARAQPAGFVPTWTNIPVVGLNGTAAANTQQANVTGVGLYCADNSGLAQLRLNVTALSTGTVNLTFSGGDGNTFISPLNRSRATYSVSVTGLVVVATTPADFLTVTGSATTTIRITHAECSGTAATISYGNVVALTRSTANAGGTSSAATPVPHDPTNPATGASGLQYTANPATPGTLVGNIRSSKIFLPLTGTPVNASNLISWDFGPESRTATQEVVLRGTGAVFALNGGGTTLAGAGSYNCSIEYTEE